MGLEAARALDDNVCWERLADAALAHGNHQVGGYSTLSLWGTPSEYNEIPTTEKTKRHRDI